MTNTKGPWRLVDGSASGHCCFRQSVVSDIYEDWDVDRKYPKSICETFDCTNSDAHLIATSPELLGVLKTIVSRYHKGEDIHECIGVAETIIGKADDLTTTSQPNP